MRIHAVLQERRPEVIQALITLCVLAVSLILGLSMIKVNPILTAVAVAALLVVPLILLWPELATLIFTFLFYVNASAVLTNVHGISQVVAAFPFLLLGFPAVFYLFFKRRKLRLGATFSLMLVFLGAATISTLKAQDVSTSASWLITYVTEGLILYFLVINVVRSMPTLRRLLAVAILATSLLGALTVYQEIFKLYNEDFAGFAQHKGEEGERTKRASGPLTEVNRYAQVLLTLAPLALFLMTGNSRFRAFLFIISTGLILSAMALTYSRGAFLALILMVMVALYLRFLKLAHVIAAGFLLAVLVGVAAPDYYARIVSIGGSTALLTGDHQEADGAIRGRTTEMLAALKVFLDHPIIGVGPNQYADFYSTKYQQDPDIALRHIAETRRAHSLYAELAAETGIIGLAAFLAIGFNIFLALWRTRLRFLTSQPELARLATAFILSLIGYFSTAFFLHLAYQRFFWFLLALAATVVHLGQEVTEQENGRPSDKSLKDSLEISGQPDPVAEVK